MGQNHCLTRKNRASFSRTTFKALLFKQKRPSKVVQSVAFGGFPVDYNRRLVSIAGGKHMTSEDACFFSEGNDFGVKSVFLKVVKTLVRSGKIDYSFFNDWEP